MKKFQFQTIVITLFLSCNLSANDSKDLVSEGIANNSAICDKTNRVWQTTYAEKRSKLRVLYEKLCDIEFPDPAPGPGEDCVKTGTCPIQ